MAALGELRFGATDHFQHGLQTMAKHEKIAGIRGMNDMFPEECLYWAQLEETARRLFASYAYGEIRTPIVEPAKLFKRGVGEGSEVVMKEMYEFTDRSGNELCLRPEGTASVVRAYVNAAVHATESISRYFYFGPMFRYERPQAGRKRQFYQLGVELLGAQSPYADAEVMAMTWNYFQALGVKKIQLEINSLGSPASQSAFNKALRDYLQKRVNELPEFRRDRVETNPLRLFDAKEEETKKVMKDAPSILDSLDAESKMYFEKVQQTLKRLNIPFTVNEKMVRGLDYYTQTIFEFTTTELGAQNAVAAGGRYDGLVEELGGSQVPGVGMAIGMDRVAILLSQQEKKQAVTQDSVYAALLSDESIDAVFPVLEKLRADGIRVEWGFEAKSLKSQMRSADKSGSQSVIIVGEDELKSGKAIVRNLRTKEQNEVRFEDLLRHFVKVD